MYMWYLAPTDYKGWFSFPLLSHLSTEAAFLIKKTAFSNNEDHFSIDTVWYSHVTNLNGTILFIVCKQASNQWQWLHKSSSSKNFFPSISDQIEGSKSSYHLLGWKCMSFNRMINYWGHCNRTKARNEKLEGSGQWWQFAWVCSSHAEPGRKSPGGRSPDLGVIGQSAAFWIFQSEFIPHSEWWCFQKT